MRQKGLLYKAKLQVGILLVLCFHLSGSYPNFNVTDVLANETDPTVTITSPKTGDALKDTTITVAGTIANFGVGVEGTLYIGTDEIPITIVDGQWSKTLLLTEGVYSIFVTATDDANLTDTSDFVTFTIDTTAPTVSIDTPTDNQIAKSPAITGKTEPNAKVHICLTCRLDGEEVIGTWEEPVTANASGEWTYEDAGLADGNYTVFVKASDKAGNFSAPIQRSFVLDKTRPKFTFPTSINNEIMATPDMTQVPIDASISLIIVDSTTLDKALIEENGLTLTLNGIATPIPGVITYDELKKVITFNPTDSLMANKKYKVVINSAYIKDAATNLAYPKSWTFTTASTPSTTHQNPHGSYSNNVNTCGNCHDTHAAKGPNLLNENMTTQTIESFSIDSYCMACHDGTVAPAPENANSNHTHKAAINIDGTPSGSSCASCHNPHSDWSEGNPNLTQDHITYTHIQDPANPNPEKPVGKISNKEQLCETCHESDSGIKIQDPAVEYRLFKYSKSHSSIGILEDYELCLRCHNDRFRVKYAQVPVIENFYSNLTESSKKAFEDNTQNPTFADRDLTEEKKFSGHIMRAKDGSPLAGHMPCAECHDTHGSNNIMGLKKKLGHENRKSDFIAESGDWDAVKERSFCIKCHNGETAVYGVTGQALDSGLSSGHNAESVASCSSCHGTGANAAEKALSAAHAPKRNP